MTRVRRATRRTFRSLGVPNYRLWFWGQVVSVSGTWMQWVAQSWLVLRLTGSGTALGIATALQFLPTLAGGLWAGAVADRRDRRTILLVTQSLQASLAFALAVLVWTGAVRLWMVYALALAIGCVMMMETPARQAFVTEMVAPEGVANAVALNSAVFNGTRIVGPAVAAILIASSGLGAAFFLNGLSYAAVIGALAAMDTRALHRTERRAPERGALRESLRYAWSNRELRTTLALVAVVTSFGMNFTVVLPLLARSTFHGDAGTYGMLSSIMAAGALAGALTTAWRARPGLGILVGAAAAFGCLAALASAAPSLWTTAALLVPTGAASIVFLSTANSLLQLRSPDPMRGRLMALYSLVMIGGSTIGGPVAGLVSERYGARVGLGLGGAVALAAAVAGWVHALRRERVVAVPGAEEVAPALSGGA